MSFRIGHGFDVHPLIVSRPLVVGGVHIPYSKGSDGHSDGDTLTHALVDAILGALSQGDIGSHFPSDNPIWKNSNSQIFLQYAMELIKQSGFKLSNIDCTVILQEPKLKNHISEIRKSLSNTMNLQLDRISVKATTTDYLGCIGRKEGVAACAIVLLEKK